MGSLPKELIKEKDVEIAIFTPLHGCIDKNKFNIKELPNSTLRILFGHQMREFKLYIAKLPDTNINVFFVDSMYFQNGYIKIMSTKDTLHFLKQCWNMQNI